MAVGVGLIAYQNLSYPSLTPTETDTVSFLAAGDVHYGYSDDKHEADVTRIYDISTENWNSVLVRAFNAILTPATKSLLRDVHSYDPRFRGVILLGDLVNNGGKVEQWKQFKSAFKVRPDGTAGELKLPVFETFGNHDYPSIDLLSNMNVIPKWDDPEMYVFRGVHNRNSDTVNGRPSLFSDANNLRMDRNSLNYAWRWKDVVFINLGVKPSNDETSDVPSSGGEPSRKTPPFGSLTFLKNTLAFYNKLNDPNIVYVLNFHYPLGNDGRITDAEKIALKDTIQGSKVVAILHAHMHSVTAYKWCGIPVFNIGSPLMSFADKSNPDKFTFSSVYSIFNLSSKELRAMTVGWRQDPPSATRTDIPVKLFLGRECGPIFGKGPDYCYDMVFRFSDILADSKTCTDSEAKSISPDIKSSLRAATPDASVTKNVEFKVRVTNGIEPYVVALEPATSGVLVENLKTDSGITVTFKGTVVGPLNVKVSDAAGTVVNVPVTVIKAVP